MFTCGVLSAQLNPKDIYVNAKVGESINVTINTVQAPSVVVEPSAHDSLSFDPIPGASQSIFTFTPIPGFIGDEDITIEYFIPGSFPGFNIPSYTTIHYRIKESKIDLGGDTELVSPGVATLIDVLSNDTSTDGALSLVKLGLVSGGSASIVNDQIEFTLGASADDGYVRYFASDSTDNVEGAVLHVVKDDDASIGNHNVFVDNLSDISLQLNSANFALANTPTGGTVTQNGHVATFTPNVGFVGVDTLSFTSANGGEITYNVEVLPKINNTSFVRDDQFFATTNSTLTFDVFENDYHDDFNIIDFSPELTHLGDGLFDYTPATDFTGDVTFFYKIFAGFQFHTGNITIHVDDYAPSQVYDYAFTILKDHDLKVTHDSPINDYTFTLEVPPSNGTVIILDANGSETLECDVISGENTIIYIPNDGYNGFDEFDLEYCTTSGVCEIVKVDVNILDSNFTDCLCLNSCVYEGDYNDDGIVNAKDVLDLGLNIGEGGWERTNDFTLIWTGQESSDWGHGQMNSSIDLKCGDGDGDGYIDYNDFLELEDHYGNLHNFAPNDVGQLSNVPITFVPQSTDVDSGEWMFIDIYIGNSNNPALDFYGTSFTFNINPDVIDSSSVNFYTHDNNWLSFQSPLYEFYTVPQDGQIDIAVSRVSNNSTDGIGLIGTLEFIIEDEIQGFKKKGNNILSQLGFNIKMTEILSVNEKGHFSIHPNQSQYIKINSQNTLTDAELGHQVNIYPNPTASIITIDSETSNLDRVEVYDALGRTVLGYNLSTTHIEQLDLSTLDQGMYFIKVYSKGQVTTKKIQKIDF